MRWMFFFGVAVAALLIIRLEWPKLKQYPGKDKAVFISLLVLVCSLAVLDLPNTPGPIAILQTIFKPLLGFMEPS